MKYGLWEVERYIIYNITIQYDKAYILYVTCSVTIPVVACTAVLWTVFLPVLCVNISIDLYCVRVEVCGDSFQRQCLHVVDVSKVQAGGSTICKKCHQCPLQQNFSPKTIVFPRTRHISYLHLGNEEHYGQDLDFLLFFFVFSEIPD